MAGGQHDIPTCEMMHEKHGTIVVNEDAVADYVKDGYKIAADLEEEAKKAAAKKAK